MSEKIKIDPNKVIKVEPKRIKSSPSPMFMGFIYGWFALYLLLKLLNIL
jgi:hypothetical protein